MPSLNKDHHPEAGQTIILFILMLVGLLSMAALSIDVGVMFVERAKVQSTVDGAAIAGADKLPDSPAAAIASAQLYAEENGVDLSGAEYTFSAVTPYASNPDQIEVQVSKDSSFIFGSVLGFDLFNVSARAVGEAKETTSSGACTPGLDPGCVPCDPAVDAGCIPCDPGETACDPGGGAAQALVPVPMSDCPGSDNAVVDGRVMPGEGYEQFSELVGSDNTDFGQAYFACDAGFLYFALELNSADSPGAVANENVYACKTGMEASAKLKNGLWKIKGPIETLSDPSFTIEAAGATWTIDTDGSTNWKGNLNDFSDLTVGMFVEAKNGVELGPNHILAGEVKDKQPKASGCGPGENDTYHSDYNTGWVESPKGAHDFKDLIKSDRARFQTSCGGTVFHDFVQDYLRDIGPTTFVSDAAGDGEVIVAGPANSASSLEWNLEHPVETGWGDDPGEIPYIPGQSKPTGGESPPFNPSYPNYDPEYDGWIWEMIYEFRVPITDYLCGGEVLFGLPDFTGASGPVGGLHSSPPKIDTGTFVGFGTTGTRTILLIE